MKLNSHFLGDVYLAERNIKSFDNVLFSMNDYHVKENLICEN